MKPTGPVFDSVWRNSCSVERVNKREIDNMIKKHYIGKWPAEVVLTLGLIKNNETLGMIVFTVPKIRLLDRFGQDTWDLARLWIVPSVPKNGESFLIGRAMRYLKKEHPRIKAVISFADPDMNHSGTIYKAANFKSEKHESMNLFSYSLSE
jgi:hypothetical protein